MQLRIYRLLNFISLLIMLLTIAGVIFIFIYRTALAASMSIVIVIFVVVAVLLFLAFKMLENNLDKVIMQKKAYKGDIVLANITSARFLSAIRDTSFKTYTLWAIAVTYYDHDMKSHETTIIEKLNPICKSIPHGTIYMTYDQKHPDRGLVVQNVIISHTPSLKPLIDRYEANKNIKIKYLNTHYDSGLVINTFEEQMAREKEYEKLKQGIKPAEKTAADIEPVDLKPAAAKKSSKKKKTH